MLITQMMRDTLHSFRTHKLRTVLSMFGIFWGTLSVVLLMAIGNGFYQKSLEHIKNINSGLIIMSPYKTSIPYHGEPSGRIINLKAGQVMALPEQISHIKAITPILSNVLKTPVMSQGQNISTTSAVEGVSSDYALIQDSILSSGSRFIDQNDIVGHQHVAVIGAKLKHDLFANDPALNQTIEISGIPFLVVGILKENKSANFTSFWDKQTCFIPYTSFQDIWGDSNIRQAFILPDEPTHFNILQTQIRQHLAHIFNFSPKDKTAVFIPDLSKGLAFFNWFFLAIQAFLGIAGMMTLAVGGLGVANILFLIITERTREIGLRMALGAKDWDIMLQIILEAFFLVFFGGGLGIVTAIMITTLMSVLPLPSWLGVPHIQIGIMLATFLILLIVALLASIFPARKAALMPPAIALKL